MPFYPTQLEAYAYFVGGTGAIITTRGCTVTRIALGNYEINLITELDTDVMICDIMLIAASGAINLVANISDAASTDSVKRIVTSLADIPGTPQDPFQLQVKIYRVLPPS